MTVLTLSGNEATAGDLINGALRLLGVLAGAAFGAALGIVVGLPWAVVQVISFAFGGLAVFVALGVGNLFGRASLITLVLGGVISTALFSSLLSMVKYVADPYNQLPTIVYWLMGSLANAELGQIGWFAPPIVLGVVLLTVLGRALDALAMGDDEAQAMGVPVVPVRYAVIGIATLLSALTVSIVGMIGWVGLVVPHIARLMEACRARNLPIFYTTAGKRADLMDATVQVGKSHRGGEKTVIAGTHATTSVATTAGPCAEDAASSAARWSTSLCRYTVTDAPDSRHPSMMLAWFSSSDTITSSLPSTAETVPALAEMGTLTSPLPVMEWVAAWEIVPCPAAGRKISPSCMTILPVPVSGVTPRKSVRSPPTGLRGGTGGRSTRKTCAPIAVAERSAALNTRQAYERDLADAAGSRMEQNNLAALQLVFETVAENVGGTHRNPSRNRPIGAARKPLAYLVGQGYAAVPDKDTATRRRHA
mgnify:CR=1 FL=1